MSTNDNDYSKKADWPTWQWVKRCSKTECKELLAKGGLNPEEEYAVMKRLTQLQRSMDAARSRKLSVKVSELDPDVISKMTVEECTALINSREYYLLSPLQKRTLTIRYDRLLELGPDAEPVRPSIRKWGWSGSHKKASGEVTRSIEKFSGDEMGIRPMDRVKFFTSQNTNRWNVKLGTVVGIREYIDDPSKQVAKIKGDDGKKYYVSEVSIVEKIEEPVSMKARYVKDKKP